MYAELLVKAIQSLNRGYLPEWVVFVQVLDDALFCFEPDVGFGAVVPPVPFVGDLVDVAGVHVVCPSFWFSSLVVHGDPPGTEKPEVCGPPAILLR